MREREQEQEKRKLFVTIWIFIHWSLCISCVRYLCGSLQLWVCLCSTLSLSLLYATHILMVSTSCEHHRISIFNTIISSCVESKLDFIKIYIKSGSFDDVWEFVNSTVYYCVSFQRIGINKLRRKIVLWKLHENQNNFRRCYPLFYFFIRFFVSSFCRLIIGFTGYWTLAHGTTVLYTLHAFGRIYVREWER